MKAPLNDQQIESLYQSGATETPSEKTDKIILDYAATQIDTESRVKKRQPWWPYMGLAASVAMVVIIAPWKWLGYSASSSSSPVAAPELKMRPDVQNSEAGQTNRASSSRAEAVVEQATVDQETVPAIDTSDVVTESHVELESAKKEVKRNKEAVHSKQQTDTSFREVDILLSRGETEQAQILLQQILQDSPELKQTLPQHLKALLAE